MLSQLQEKQEEIISLYNQHEQTTLELKRFLNDDVLGELEGDLDERVLEGAREWCNDTGVCLLYGECWRILRPTTGSIFRTLKVCVCAHSKANLALIPLMAIRNTNSTQP